MDFHSYNFAVTETCFLFGIEPRSPVEKSLDQIQLLFLIELIRMSSRLDTVREDAVCVRDIGPPRNCKYLKWEISYNKTEFIQFNK